MSVRVELKGPVTVYRFRRGRDERVTLEMPAIVLPETSQSTSTSDAPPAQPVVLRRYVTD